MKKLIILIILLFATLAHATITATDIDAIYTGDDSDTTFDFSFDIFATSEVAVYLVTTATGVATLQTETTHYAVSATNNNYRTGPGGTVTMVTAPASTEQLYIYHAPPLTQTFNVNASSSFRNVSTTTMENTLDQLSGQVQYLEHLIGLCIKIPVQEHGLTVEAEVEPTRDNKYLAWADDGTLTSTAGTSSDVVLPASTDGNVMAGNGSAWTSQSKTLLDGRDYLPSGYVTDGSIDYATEIQACIDAAIAASKGVIWPAGTYRFESQIDFTGGTLTFEGTGFEKTIFQKYGNFDGFKIDMTGGTFKRFKMTSATGQGDVSSGIYIEYATDCIFEQVYVTAQGDDAWLIDGGFRSVYTLCHGLNSGGAGFHLKFNDSGTNDNLAINDNTFDRINCNNNPGHGFWMDTGTSNHACNIGHITTEDNTGDGVHIKHGSKNMFTIYSESNAADVLLEDNAYAAGNMLFVMSANEVTNPNPDENTVHWYSSSRNMFYTGYLGAGSSTAAFRLQAEEDTVDTNVGRLKYNADAVIGSNKGLNLWNADATANSKGGLNLSLTNNAGAEVLGGALSLIKAQAWDSTDTDTYDSALILATAIDGTVAERARISTAGVLQTSYGVNVGGGVLTYSATPQSLSGAGEINATTAITELTTTGANALTIANGTEQGQVKYIMCIVDGGEGTLTDAVLHGTSLVFTDDGDSATLVWTNSKWYVVGATATFTP